MPSESSMVAPVTPASTYASRTSSRNSSLFSTKTSNFMVFKALLLSRWSQCLPDSITVLGKNTRFARCEPRAEVLDGLTVVRRHSLCHLYTIESAGGVVHRGALSHVSTCARCFMHLAQEKSICLKFYCYRSIFYFLWGLSVDIPGG